MHSPPVQDALSEPLVIILAHPNHTVCVTVSWTLRCFCYSTPLRLVLMERLQRDLMLINTPSSTQEASQRALWHTYGLAALVSAIPKRPLYVLTQRFLDTATQQLKRASDHDLKVASIEVEVAWMLIVSLMSLGPNFVRPYLLVLWCNVCACVDAAWLSAPLLFLLWGQICWLGHVDSWADGDKFHAWSQLHIPTEIATSPSRNGAIDGLISTGKPTWSQFIYH